MSYNICDKCGRELNGLYWGYGKMWTCSDCAEDKTDVLHCEKVCKVKVRTLEAGYDSEQREAEKTF
ncbi:MAG: hypothetical protein Q4C12_00055 [Clostridia bacterium]|nr:hypothetical protein [Clostridia bacterium]